MEEIKKNLFLLKVHPNRPTLTQKIYNMRHQNRIDVCFTKPLSETNNCVYRKRSMSKLFQSINYNII